jgi:molybdopterin molybdotransferase
MRGFRSRSTVEAALAWVDAQAPVRPPVEVPLEQAAGRTLVEDVVSPIDVPAFDRSAMDGYALRGDETTGAGDYNPLSFEVIGQSLPGRAFAETVGPGQAVRIMTGAPLPAGADAVLPAEYANEADGRVEITAGVAPDRHVGRIGEDIAAGTTVLSRGRRLRPQDVGLLASLGIAQIAVVQQPRVRVIVTGGELALPGEQRREHQIYEANSFMLRGLIARDGGVLESLLRIADDRDRLREGLTAAGTDVVLVSGGSSVGAEDFAPTLVAEHGELAIHGVAMRPSSPTGIGRVGQALVVLLPGNPVSCLCAYDFFAGRAIRQMAGRPAEWPYRRSHEITARKIASQVGRVDYCRVRRDERGIVPVAISGASILSSTTQADGFVIVPAESEGVAAGSSIDVYWYDG